MFYLFKNTQKHIWQQIYLTTNLRKLQQISRTFRDILFIFNLLACSRLNGKTTAFTKWNEMVKLSALLTTIRCWPGPEVLSQISTRQRTSFHRCCYPSRHTRCRTTLSCAVLPSPVSPSSAAAVSPPRFHALPRQPIHRLRSPKWTIPNK